MLYLIFISTFSDASISNEGIISTLHHANIIYDSLISILNQSIKACRGYARFANLYFSHLNGNEPLLSSSLSFRLLLLI
jgi:hypothetical protein